MSAIRVRFHSLPLPSLRAGSVLPVLALVLVLPGCVGSSTSPDLEGISGQWCTEGTIGPNDQPVVALPYLALVLGQDGSMVQGSGAVKRADSTELWAVRYDGTRVGDAASLQVTAFDQTREDAPSFFLDLTVQTSTTMTGVVGGDDGFPGTLNLVRVGERCFTD
jgi:hypothetical protein